MTHAARIARALRHVDAHLAGDLSLDVLADVAALSRFHFSRVFRGLTGEGVADAVRRTRLNRAAILVVATRDPLAAIAARVGFGHPDSFDRAFASAFGTTPFQMRQTGRLPPPLLPPQKGLMTMFPSELRTAPDTTLAAVPHKGAYPRIGIAFGTLMIRMQHAGVAGTGPCYGLYYDDPAETPVAELRAHAGQQIAATATLPADLDRVVIPGGRFLVVTCIGPFSKLPEAWAWAYARALPEAGLDPRDAVPFERYVSMDGAAPEDSVTEIWVPVA